MNTDQVLAVLDHLRQIVASGAARGDSVKGQEFEFRFSDICRERGLSVERPAKRAQYDLLVNGWRCQCKCRTLSPRGYFIIQPATRPAYSPEDFDVLVAEVDGTLCIAPASDIPRQRDGMIQSNMRPGHLLRFQDAWWVLEGGDRPPGFCKQLCLDLISTDGEADGR